MAVLINARPLKTMVRLKIAMVNQTITQVAEDSGSLTCQIRYLWTCLFLGYRAPSERHHSFQDRDNLIITLPLCEFSQAVKEDQPQPYCQPVPAHKLQDIRI